MWYDSTFDSIHAWKGLVIKNASALTPLKNHPKYTEVQHLKMGGFITPANSELMAGFIAGMSSLTRITFENPALWLPTVAMDWIRKWPPSLTTIEEPDSEFTCTRLMVQSVSGRAIQSRPSLNRTKSEVSAAVLNSEVNTYQSPMLIAKDHKNAITSNVLKSSVAKGVEASEKTLRDAIITLPLSFTGSLGQTSFILYGITPFTQGSVLRIELKNNTIPVNFYNLKGLQRIKLYNQFLKNVDRIDLLKGKSFAVKDGLLRKSMMDENGILPEFQAPEPKRRYTEVKSKIQTNLAGSKSWFNDLTENKASVVPKEQKELLRRTSNLASPSNSQLPGTVTILKGGALGMIIPDETVRQWDLLYKGSVPLNVFTAALRNPDNGTLRGVYNKSYSLAPPNAYSINPGYIGLNYVVRAMGEGGLERKVTDYTLKYMRGFMLDGDSELAVWLPESSQVPFQNRSSLIKIITAIHPDHTNTEIEESFKWIPNATFARSAIQTIIQYGPSMISHPNSSIKPKNAKLLLSVAQAYLISSEAKDEKSPSGMSTYLLDLASHALRLSYTSKHAIINDLIATHWVCSKVKWWCPELKEIERWIRFGLSLYDELDLFQLWSEEWTPPPENAEETFKVILSETTTIPEELSVFMLSRIKDCPKPLKQTACIIARNKGARLAAADDVKIIRPSVMKWTHTIRPDFFPHMVHFIDRLKNSFERFTKDVYTLVFSTILAEVCDLSLRIQSVETIQSGFTSPVQKSIVEAQDLYWDAAFSEDSSVKELRTYLESPKGPYRYTYEVHPSWIAGGLGHIIAYGGGRTGEVPEFLTLDPTDLITIKGSLKLERIAEAKKLLRSGTKTWTGNTPPVPGWKNLSIKMDEKSEILLGGVKWSERRKGYEMIPTFLLFQESEKYKRGFNFYDRGMATSGMDWLKNSISDESKLSIWEARRLLGYISNHRDVIQIVSLTSEGYSDMDHGELALLEDTAVFQFLLDVCHHFPFALSFRKTDLAFVVKYPAFIQMIKEWLRLRLTNNSKPSVAWDDQKLSDTKQRVLRDKQREAIQLLKDRDRSGETSHMVWKETGTGKTLIAIEFQLSIRKKFDYILHVGPKTSIDGMYNEYRSYGFKVKVMQPKRMLYSSNDPYNTMESLDVGEPLVPGTVYILDQDHMRNPSIYERFTPEVIGRTSLVFDEFQYLTNESTQKTHWRKSLEMMARTVIYLSATPVADEESLKKLIPILENTSQYQITDKDYRVAVNTITKQDSTTDIRSIDVVFPVELTPTESTDGKSGMQSGLDRGVIMATIRALQIEESKDPNSRDPLYRPQIGVLVRARSAEVRDQYFMQLQEHGIDPRSILLVGERKMGVKDNPRMKNAQYTRQLDLSVGSVIPNTVKVMIVPKDNATAFNAPRFRHSVDPIQDNMTETQHKQWRGRMKRESQISKVVYHWIPVDSKGLVSSYYPLWSIPPQNSPDIEEIQGLGVRKSVGSGGASSAAAAASTKQIDKIVIDDD